MVETPLKPGNEIFLYPKGRKTDTESTEKITSILGIPELTLNGRAKQMQAVLHDPSLLLAVTSGLEEATLNGLLIKLEQVLSTDAREARIPYDLVREVVSSLEALAVRSYADVAMSARRVKQGIRQVTRGALLEGVKPLQAGGGGLWAESDVFRPTVFRFNHSDTVAWALPVAAVGAPVVVVTEYEVEAHVLRELFKTSEIPQERYLVVSREEALWEDKAVERFIEKRFPERSYEVRPLPPGVGLLDVEKFLNRHGLVFYSDVTDVVNKTRAYLESWA